MIYFFLSFFCHNIKCAGFCYFMNTLFLLFLNALHTSSFFDKYFLQKLFFFFLMRKINREKTIFTTVLADEQLETQSQKKLFSRSSIHYINQKYTLKALSVRSLVVVWQAMIFWACVDMCRLRSLLLILLSSTVSANDA